MTGEEAAVIDWRLLLDLAAEAGIDPLRFWELTLPETLIVLEARARLRQQQQDLAAWVAWHVAALGRARKLPSLRRLQGGRARRALRGSDLEQRRREHEDLAATVDQDKVRAMVDKAQAAAVRKRRGDA